jgi:lipoprotein NlpI
LQDEDEAIRLAPKLAKAHLYRGIALGKLGNSDAMVEETKIAIGLDPSLAKQVKVNQDNRSAKPPP